MPILKKWRRITVPYLMYFNFSKYMSLQCIAAFICLNMLDKKIKIVGTKQKRHFKWLKIPNLLCASGSDISPHHPTFLNLSLHYTYPTIKSSTPILPLLFFLQSTLLINHSTHHQVIRITILTENSDSVVIIHNFII